MKNLHTTIDALVALQAHARLIEEEITVVDLIGLSIVSRNPGIIPTKIAKKRSTSLSNITGMVERGVKIGIFERRDNPDDRRKCEVHLTEKGKTIVKHLLALDSTAA